MVIILKVYKKDNQPIESADITSSETLPLDKHMEWTQNQW